MGLFIFCHELVPNGKRKRQGIAFCISPVIAFVYRSLFSTLVMRLGVLFNLHQTRNGWLKLLAFKEDDVSSIGLTSYGVTVSGSVTSFV